MTWTKRDCKLGGERFPVPTQGEIEGKLIVLESIAIACLKGAISRRDKAAVERLRTEVGRLVEQRCEPLKLAPDDVLAARQYALEFFDAVVESTLDRQDRS